MEQLFIRKRIRATKRKRETKIQLTFCELSGHSAIDMNVK